MSSRALYLFICYAVVLTLGYMAYITVDKKIVEIKQYQKELRERLYER